MERLCEFFQAMMLLYVASLAMWQHEKQIQQGSSNLIPWA